jgi:hypothetical protein
MTNSDPFDLNNLKLDPEVWPERRAVTPRKIERRREHFVMVPWTWVEALSGASGQSWHLAMHLLYLHWKGEGCANQARQRHVEGRRYHQMVQVAGIG